MNDPQIDQASLLPVGTLLQGGKYRIEKYLSSGNFGNTYVVTNVAFGEKRCMKEFFLRGYCYRTNMRQVTMSPAVAPERINQQREKFKKEAQRMYGLKSEHVVHIYDLFDENGTTYYVMDYVQGESLASYMEHTGKPLTEEQTLFILDQLLDALEEIHQKKIWHLDLKPDNILIDRNGKVVIIDFGASKQIGASGKYTGTTGVLCYTPGYAPIEQMGQDMESIGPWTDIYALGATLYNLLTNITPTVQMGAQLNYPVPVSKRTRDLIAWMLSVERQKRPQSIKAIRGFLSQQVQKPNPVQPQKPVQSPKPVQPQRPTPQPKNSVVEDDSYEDEDDEERPNRKWLFIGIGGGVIALIILLLIALSGKDKDDRYNWDEEDISAVEVEEQMYADSIAAIQAQIEALQAEQQAQDEARAAADKAREEQAKKEAEARARKEAQEDAKWIMDDIMIDEELPEEVTKSQDELKPQDPAEKSIEAVERIYDVVEQMPSFPGGDAALISFLSNNIKYPAFAEENGIQGRVVCSFVVERDGSISDIKVVRPVDPSLDKEAVRVLKSMPKWIPGKNNGRAVRVRYTAPITFRLQ